MIKKYRAKTVRTLTAVQYNGLNMDEVNEVIGEFGKTAYVQECLDTFFAVGMFVVNENGAIRFLKAKTFETKYEEIK